VAASFFLLTRFALGEAAGDAEVAGDAAAWAEDVVSAFLCARFFAGDGD
jgi:hypothetical protein